MIRLCKSPRCVKCVCVPAASLGQSAILQIEIRLARGSWPLHSGIKKAGLMLRLGGSEDCMLRGAIACLRVYAPCFQLMCAIWEFRTVDGRFWVVVFFLIYFWFWFFAELYCLWNWHLPHNLTNNSLGKGYQPTRLWAASSHCPWQAGMAGWSCVVKPQQLDRSEMEARRCFVNPAVLHLSWCQGSGKLSWAGQPGLCWTIQEVAGLQVKL